AVAAARPATPGRLAVVSGHTGAVQRHHPGWPAVAGGSLHLCPSPWVDHRTGICGERPGFLEVVAQVCSSTHRKQRDSRPGNNYMVSCVELAEQRETIQTYIGNHNGQSFGGISVGRRPLRPTSLSRSGIAPEQSLHARSVRETLPEQVCTGPDPEWP